MAINLADGLKALGAEVVIFVPQLSNRVRYFPPIVAWRKAVALFIMREGPFDIIDAPAQVITRNLSKKAVCIARSVQPELRYQWVNIINAPLLSPLDWLRFIKTCLIAVLAAYSHLCGWMRAHAILCLGSAELIWMEERFPFWKKKLHCYMNALSTGDQKELTRIRNTRLPRGKKGVGFLWIGRLSPHKGIHRLISFIKRRMEVSPSDTFTVAGCGQVLSYGMINEIIRDKRVRIIPQFKREELIDLLTDHDVGLFTSEVEGWGLSLNEMLESGMPVYATQTGGVGDLQSKVGTLLRSFPPGASIETGKDMPSIDWSEYYNSFSWDMIAVHYLTICSALLPTESIRNSGADRGL